MLNSIGVQEMRLDFEINGVSMNVVVDGPAGGTNQVAQTTHSGGPFAGTVIGEANSVAYDRDTKISISVSNFFIFFYPPLLASSVHSSIFSSSNSNSLVAIAVTSMSDNPPKGIGSPPSNSLSSDISPTH